jgi:hypothetical protein
MRLACPHAALPRAISESNLADTRPQLRVLSLSVVHLLAVLASLAEHLLLGFAEELPVALPTQPGLFTS